MNNSQYYTILLLCPILFIYPLYGMQQSESTAVIAKPSTEISAVNSCIKAIKYDDSHTLESLIKDQLCDLNYHDELGNTYLLLAIYHDAYESICILLKNNINPSVINKENISALILAIDKINPDIVKKLITYNADINPQQKNAPIPLIHAISKMTSNYDHNIPHLREIVTTLITNKANVNQCDHKGMFPLKSATSNHNEWIVRYLLENNATIDQRDPEGKTCLELAEDTDDRPIIYLLEQYKSHKRKPFSLTHISHSHSFLDKHRPPTITTYDPCQSPQSSDSLIKDTTSIDTESKQSKSSQPKKNSHCLPQ